MSEKTLFAIASYRPHAGKEAELREILREHEPALRREGLITDFPFVQLQAADGTLIELFEWKSEAAKDAAHRSPVVWPIWERMMAAAEMVPLSSVEEAQRPFAGFVRK